MTNPTISKEVPMKSESLENSVVNCSNSEESSYSKSESFNNLFGEQAQVEENLEDLPSLIPSVPVVSDGPM